jgi:hypothetical protein
LTEYKSCRYVNKKIRQVIVDNYGDIINTSPNKEDLKGLKTEPYNTKTKYTDEELLDYLIQFYEENGRHPTEIDFVNNLECPNYTTYKRRFGSWINALKLAGLDVDLMSPQGNSYRGRQSEIKVLNHFRKHPIDLAGKNQRCPFDGVCPNGLIYEVKSSKFYNGGHWLFGTNNKYKTMIEIYYFLAFNSDWTKLVYAWRIPGKIVEKDSFLVRLDQNYEFNVENMKQYDITDIIKQTTGI